MQTPRIPPMALLVMPCGLQSARERSKRSGLKWVRRARSGPGVGAWPNNQRLARDCGFESTSVQSVFLLYLRASKPRAPAPRAAHIHMPHLSRFGRAHPPFGVSLVDSNFDSPLRCYEGRNWSSSWREALSAMPPRAIGWPCIVPTAMSSGRTAVRMTRPEGVGSRYVCSSTPEV